MSVDTERSFGAVIRDIGGNVDRIIRAEFRFAIAELKQALAAAGVGAALVLAGALCATLAVGFLFLGIMFALALIMPTWAAALVVALIVGVTAAGLFVYARERLQNKIAVVVKEIAPHRESPE